MINVKLANNKMILSLKSKNYPKFVKDSISGLKLLPFHLSDVTGLDTIKHASAVWAKF